MGAGRKTSKFIDKKKETQKSGGLFERLGLTGGSGNEPKTTPIGSEHKADGQGQAEQKPRPSEGTPVEKTKKAVVDQTAMSAKPPKEVKTDTGAKK